MDIPKLLQIATASQLAADEAFDTAIHIAMVEAVKEISARWPRRRLLLTAGMGSCTIDVPGKVCGRPVLWRFAWVEEGLYLNDARYADARPHSISPPWKLEFTTDLIDLINETSREVHRDPVDYCDEFVCLGGKVIPKETES